MATRLELPSHRFWDFSLRVYGSAGVAEACLALQEKHAIDVNVLLFCCWCGEAKGAALPPGAVGGAVAAVAPWHAEVVRALRAIRRRLKEGFAGIPPERVRAIRKAVAATEIEAEHIEQLLLAETVAVGGGDAPVAARAGAAAANAAAYLSAVGMTPAADDLANVATVLAAAFPGLAPAAARALLDEAAKR